MTRSATRGGSPATSCATFWRHAHSCHLLAFGPSNKKAQSCDVQVHLAQSVSSHPPWGPTFASLRCCRVRQTLGSSVARAVGEPRRNGMGVCLQLTHSYFRTSGPVQRPERIDMANQACLIYLHQFMMFASHCC